MEKLGNRKDLLIISKKWSTNRGKYTSVERFCALVDPEFPNYHGQRLAVHPQLSRFFKGTTNSISAPAFGYSAPYNSFSFELELWALKETAKRHPDVVFFPYADYDYYYFRYLRNLLGIRIVLWSFFSTHELIYRFKNLKHFQSADLVLAAGQEQVRFLKGSLPNTDVQYFPVGVDTSFFQPGNMESDRTPRIIHIGANRRDFPTLIRAFDALFPLYPDLRVDLVGAHTIKEQLPERAYLHVHGFLEDEKYLALLQKATIGVLCLKDGGSSNSLLEMIACGLPVIVTDLGNIQDYLNDNFCIKTPKGDATAISTACRSLLDNLGMRQRMSIAARRHSESFSWVKLQIKFEQILNELTAKDTSSGILFNKS